MTSTVLSLLVLMASAHPARSRAPARPAAPAAAKEVPSAAKEPPTTPPPGASLLPKVPGWKLSDGPTTYTPDTLFEYIDGGADTFLLFDFEELTAAAYTNPEKAEVTVDIYRHRSPARAFGMYTQERPSGTTALPVGIEGYAGPDHLEMVAGPYYVKLTLARSTDASILRTFADKLGVALPGTRKAPAVLSWFPSRGKRPRAERLTARDFLGHPFLHDACAVPYDVDGAHFRLFVVEGKDDADAHEMVRRYLAASGGHPDGGVTAEGTAEVKDRLNGPVQLAWKGRWIWGAVDDASPARQPLLEELGRKVTAATK